jgi:hypothetical protein
LLYEACGRIVNPAYGLVELLWSGSWPLAEAAVEAVMKGEQIVLIPSDAAATAPVLNPTYDIRRVETGPGSKLPGSSALLSRAMLHIIPGWDLYQQTRLN